MSGDDILRGRMMVDPGGGGSLPIPEPISLIPADGPAILKIDTPRSKWVLGKTSRREHSFSDGVRARLGPTITGEATFTLTMLGERPGSGRCQVAVTGAAENTGMIWRDTAKGRELDSWGGPPTRIEAVACVPHLPGTPATVRVQALDAKGQPGGALTVETAEPGSVRVHLCGRAALWYLVTWGGS